MSNDNQLNYYSIFQKGNETERHYMLKQISKYVAFQRGFKICAEEVNLFSTNKLGNKNIAEIVGVDMLRQIAYRNTVETLFIRHGIKERS